MSLHVKIDRDEVSSRVVLGLVHLCLRRPRNMYLVILFPDIKTVDQLAWTILKRVITA